MRFLQIVIPLHLLFEPDPGANASRLSQGKPVATFPDHVPDKREEKP
jgi:hypothetical protein